jgi:hypothetical protein
MNKRRLLLPFFVLKLSFVNLVFFTSILIIPIHRQKLLFFSSVTLVLYLFFLGKHILPKKPQLTDSIKLINVKSQQGELITFKDFSKLKLFKNKLVGLDKISPNNRDVLVNLSLISFYQNEIKNHNYLWKKALETDPNNPLFKVN